MLLTQSSSQTGSQQVIGQSGVYPRNQCATSLCSGRGCLKGKRGLHRDFFSGPGVQVQAHEIRSFWQVGVISNFMPPTEHKNSGGDGDRQSPAVFKRSDI